MVNKNPKKNSNISWVIIVAGTLSALIGAMMTREYRVNFLVWTGLLIIIAGVIYHLATVRCPYCGHSFAGYRPLPKTCPKCQKTFKD